MTKSEETERDLTDRGYSRRQAARIMGLFGSGMAAASVVRSPARAQTGALSAAALEGKVRIGSNECWAGPFPAGRDAAFAIVDQCNFYHPAADVEDFQNAMSAVEDVAATHILPWPGSTDPLSRAVITYASPDHGLVTCDFSYEDPWSVAKWAGAKITKALLTSDYRHDVKAMLAADPNGGLYYICNPNNPTGTITPLADIEWLLANKPAGSVVMVDEAYLHFSHAQSAVPLVAQGKDIIILRTFSKMFGMAGMRIGASMARPDLHEKMMRYDGRRASNLLPLPSIACATASLQQKAAIMARKAAMIAARDMTTAHLSSRGIKFIPSDANMLMVDWGKPAGPVKEQFLKAGVIIGRSWPQMPTASRVTVGSMADMKAFCAAVDKIMA